MNAPRVPRHRNLHSRRYSNKIFKVHINLTVNYASTLGSPRIVSFIGTHELFAGKGKRKKTEKRKKSSTKIKIKKKRVEQDSPGWHGLSNAQCVTSSRKSSSYCHARPRDLVQRTIIARLSTYKFRRITRDSVGRSSAPLITPPWKTAQEAMNFQKQRRHDPLFLPLLLFSSAAHYVGGRRGRGRSTLAEFEDRPVSATREPIRYCWMVEFRVGGRRYF